MSMVDLRSDTVTQPGPEMRAAMASAAVGDDVYGEDPSINRLQAQAAEIMGKEAALFMPSGTMANQVAVRTHTRPGDAIIVGQAAHVFLFESGAAAALSGVQPVILGQAGFFDADEVRAAIYPSDAHFARTRLVCVENTHNASGGRVFPLPDQVAIAQVAKDAGLRMHLDGARLFNAAIASNQPVVKLAASYDSVSFCLSKGLGAPVGSMLCGSRAFVEEAHRYRKMFGGGMRQAGILAAAGSYALEHQASRLAEDHVNARRLARGLREIPGVSLAREPETNMVLFRVPDRARFIAEMRAHRVLVGTVGTDLLRAVLHLDVHASGVDRTLEACRNVLA